MYRGDATVLTIIGEGLELTNEDITVENYVWRTCIAYNFISRKELEYRI